MCWRDVAQATPFHLSGAIGRIGQRRKGAFTASIQAVLASLMGAEFSKSLITGLSATKSAITSIFPDRTAGIPRHYELTLAAHVVKLNGRRLNR